jgi:lincosamide nucleotidyltransferase A/C/D/E
MALDDAVALMEPFPERWWVAGGVALELHLGRSWRTHDDTDVGICRRDARHLPATLDGWEFAVAAQGRLVPWDGRELSVDAHENNLWCRQDGGPWRLDVTLGEGDDDRWIFRRDRSLALPWRRVVLRTAAGVPYIAPAIELLFKSADVRPKDQLDAEVVIPALDRASVALLSIRLADDHPWAGPVAEHHRGVTAAEVLELVGLLEAAQVAVWVDGGWGVDALLGEQTRAHADLDIAVPTRHLARTRDVLADASFALVRDDGPFNVVLGDDAGRLIDVHSFDDTTTVVGADGIERHGPNGLSYEAGGFVGEGLIDGRPVKCMSAAFQMRSHTGYTLHDTDWHDVSNLHRRFGLPIPVEYDEWRADDEEGRGR